MYLLNITSKNMSSPKKKKKKSKKLINGYLSKWFQYMTSKKNKNKNLPKQDIPF